MLDILNEVQESPVMRNRLLVSTLGQRPGHGTLVDDITIEDPKAYTQPWNVQLQFQLKAGAELKCSKRFLVFRAIAESANA
jgi:hypothetical protein